MKAKKLPNQKTSAFFIPDDRRVLATDLLLFLEEFDLTVFDACLILGIQYGTWYKMTKRKNVNKEIKDQALCMLLRYYSKNPDKVPHEEITIFDLLAATENIKTKVTPRKISIMMGRQSAAAHRYISESCGFNNYASRLAKHLRNEIIAGDKNFKEWEKLVEVEAESRGVKNIWSTGTWAPEKDKKQSN